MTAGPPPGMFHSDMAEAFAVDMSPSATLPAGAWDCHAHAFGPFETFPLASSGAYNPPLAPYDAYVRMLDAVGFAHGVLVQPAAYGFDNTALLDALDQSAGRLRGVAVVAPETSVEDLVAMRSRGVRGLRLTEPIGGRGLGSEVLRFSDVANIGPKAKAAGLHLQVWADAATLAAHAETFATAETPVVIDHMGQFDVTEGVGGAAFAGLLKMVARPSVWLKLPALRNARALPSLNDVRPFHEALVAVASDRLVWGTDWPFIALGHVLPNPARLIDSLAEWSSAEHLRAILVDNPNRLYA